MIIKDIFKEKGKILEGEDIKNVLKKILIGFDDGSSNIVMRYFLLDSQGHTPFHSHDFEHLIVVIEGKGYLVDSEKKEHLLEFSKVAFVPPNEYHQFRNPFKEPFGFICIVPSKGEKM